MNTKLPRTKQDYAKFVRKEMTQMLKLAHKDFRTAFINIFKNSKEKMDTVSKQMEILSREIKTLYMYVYYIYTYAYM